MIELNQGMIVLTARIVARPAERREFSQALVAWLAAARQDAALQFGDVYEDLEVPATFGLVTAWRTSAALDAHLRSDAFGVLQGALRVLARPHRMTIIGPTPEPLTETMAAIHRLWNDQEADA